MKINEHTEIREGSIHCDSTTAAGSVWSRSLEKTEHTRKNNSVVMKTVLSHISNTRKGIVLQGRPILLVLIITMIISEKWLLRNTFGLKVFS